MLAPPRTEVLFLDLDNTIWYGGLERHGHLFAELLHRLENGLSLEEPIALSAESFAKGWTRYASLLHLAAPEQLDVFLAQLVDAGRIAARDVEALRPRCARWLDARYLDYVREPEGLQVAGPDHERGRTVRLVPGAERVIDEIRRAPRGGRPHVVGLTLNLESLSVRVLEHLGVIDAFDEVVGTAWERPTIAKARHVRAVTARLGVPAARALVVGDSAGDVACARETGAASVAIATGPTPATALSAADPDDLVEAWPSSPARLRSLLGLTSCWRIGVDVGGTKTRAALVDVHGRVAAPVYVTATPSLRACPELDVAGVQAALVEHVARAYETVRDATGVEIDGCGVSFAGVVVDRGVVVKAADLFGVWGSWASENEIENQGMTGESFPLRGLLEARTGARWVVENDLIAALVRYRRRPRYRSSGAIALLTVSTGIGYAIVARDPNGHDRMRLVSLGHHTIDRSPDAVACDCGGVGHLTSYASGKGVEARLREAVRSDEARFARSSLRGTELRNADLVSAVREGDALAISVLHRSIDHLAVGVRLMLDRERTLERVILGGGFLHATADVHRSRLIETLVGTHGLDEARLEELFVLGESDDLDGVVGAGCLASENDD